LYDDVITILNQSQVLEVVSKLKGVSEEELAKISYENTIKMFKIRDD
jgi:Tat protein secretion system quality control protein TatD with DNase activity